MDGAQALIKTLDDLGIEYIFGYSGGAAIPIFDALETVKTKMKFILVRHEQGAVHMADGYARATGKPAAVLVTSGPGAGNTVTGLMTAMMDSVPMLVISGQTVTWMLGKDAFQEADIFGITIPVVKHNYLVKDTNTLPRIAREAYHIATTGRPGPVLIDVPKNISQGDFTGDMDAPMNLPGYDPSGSFKISQAKVKEAATMISQAKRPVILAGQGAMIARADKELRYLAETLGAPVTTTLLGKGVFPETHPLSLGMVGMHGTAYANKAMIECDLLINVGSRFDDRIIGQPAKFCKDANIIHIDIDPAELGKVRRPDVPIVGDARLVAEELIRVLRNQGAPDNQTDRTPWRSTLSGWQEKYPLTYEQSAPGGLLKPQFVLEQIRDLSPRDTIVASGVGQHQMWTAQYWNFQYPYTWINSGGLGTMGFSVPAAIGAKVGMPDRTVWAIDGDGCFQMTAQEMVTAATERIPVKIAILNNAYLGMVRQWQEMFYEERYSEVYLSPDLPDYVKWAEAMGCVAMRVESPEEVAPAIEKANSINDRPVVLEFRTDASEKVFPMVPPGSTNSQIVVGPGEEDVVQ